MVNSTIANTGPQPLGRNLAGVNTVTVNLIPNATQYLDRRNNIDFRAAKILRFGRTRTQVGVDIYNVMNNDTVTAVNATFNPAITTGSAAWRSPSGIATARFVKFNLQVDF